MRKLVSSLLIFVLAFFFIFVSPVSAKVLSSENGSVDVPKSEVINDDLFVGAQGATIEGTVNGDVFIGAQSVRIEGTINGNLHVGAQTVNLDGTVKGNTYIGAQDVTLVGANIGGSLLVGSQNINIDKTSVVGGSLIAGASSLTLDSQIKRNVYAGTGILTIGADTKIGKNLYYAAGQNQQTNIDKNAKIAGSIFKSETQTPQINTNLEAAKKEIPSILNGIKVATSFISLIGALIVAFIYLKLFEKHFTQTASIVSTSFWKSLGVGFLVTIAFVPGLIILLITVVGIPIAGLAILMLILYSYLAQIVVGSVVGTWISHKINWKVSVYGATAFGLLTIYILKFIPFIGFLSGLVVLWAGLGALTIKFFSKAE